MSIGFGQVVVIVPANADVTVRAGAGFGGLDVLGDSRGGVDSRITRTDLGADGPGGGALDLDLHSGFGHLEVRRAAA